MAEKVKRTKTRYTSIYFNENTVYDPKTGTNNYKAKWVYNLSTLTEARKALVDLQTGQRKEEGKDITLKGALELWKIKAKAQDFSPVTISTTEGYMEMVYQFLPEDTKLKDIDESVYEKFCADIRAHGYSEESLRSINASFRKLINLAYCCNKQNTKLAA